MKIGFLDESKGTATQRCTKHGQRHKKQVAGEKWNQGGAEAAACGRGI